MKHHEFGKTSLKRLDGVQVLTLLVANAGLKLSPYDFGIGQHGGFRTAEQQNQLFKSGASTLDGYTKKSYHQTGLAFDFYVYEVGKPACYDRDKMAIVAVAIMQAAQKLNLVHNGIEYRVEWGGLWSNPCDMPHIQLVEK